MQKEFLPIITEESFFLLANFSVAFSYIYCTSKQSLNYKNCMSFSLEKWPLQKHLNDSFFYFNGFTGSRWFLQYFVLHYYWKLGIFILLKETLKELNIDFRCPGENFPGGFHVSVHFISKLSWKCSGNYFNDLTIL